MKNEFPFIPYKQEFVPEDVMVKKSKEFFEWAHSRRSVRDFSNKRIPKEVIENIVKTAGTAPSGANKQPWTFAVINNAEIKKKIREAAEQEEKEFYDHKISDEWRKDLAHLGTNWQKPHLEKAPYLIVVFKQDYGLDQKTEEKSKHYYVNESVGIAVGMLIMAIHNAGLVTLTHTPQPMKFLSDILKRPKNEKPFVILPVGYPAEDAVVPDQRRKEINDIMITYD